MEAERSALSAAVHQVVAMAHASPHPHVAQRVMLAPRVAVAKAG